jgi:hypothetical protein
MREFFFRLPSFSSSLLLFQMLFIYFFISLLIYFHLLGMPFTVPILRACTRRCTRRRPASSRSRTSIGCSFSGPSMWQRSCLLVSLPLLRIGPPTMHSVRRRIMVNAWFVVG